MGHTKQLRLTTLVLFRRHRCKLSIMKTVRDIKVAQRELHEGKEETQKEGASDTHPIRCPCWKTWQKQVDHKNVIDLRI
jgi:hypothetical protein